MKYIIIILLISFSTKQALASHKTYYKNGEIKSASKKEKLWRKGKVIKYDSLGNVTTKFKLKLGKKHGKYKEYKNGKVIKRIKYKYGRKANSFKTSSGKKVKIYLISGILPGTRSCAAVVEKYQVVYFNASGCRITPLVAYKKGIHNFWVNFHLTFKYGVNWKSKVDTICN